MFKAYVHSSTPTVDVVGSKGQWSFPMGDGTYLIAMAHDDIAACRHQLSSNPNVVHLLPTRTSKVTIPATTHTTIASFITAYGKNYGLTPSIAAAVGVSTIDDILNAVYGITGDPAFMPENSL